MAPAPALRSLPRGRLEHPANYRSRATFKLLELDACPASRGDVFLSAPHVRAVVDLGAAPGGWAQVVAGKLGAKPVDAPKRERRPDRDETEADADSWNVPPGPSREATILALDLLSMDPIPGVRSLQAEFLAPATGHKDAGVLVMKYFQHPWLSEVRHERLKPVFRTVDSAKPNASRADFSAAYFICKGWRWRGSQS